MSDVLYCDQPAPPPEYPQMEQEVFELVNQKREQSGLKPLALNSKLTEEARKQAKRSADSGKLSHTCHYICCKLGERLNKAGYKFSYACENLSSREDAVDIVRGWSASPGHSVNMYNPRVKETGVGVFEGNGLRITCQIYAQPRSSEDIGEGEVAEPPEY